MDIPSISNIRPRAITELIDSTSVFLIVGWASPTELYPLLKTEFRYANRRSADLLHPLFYYVTYHNSHKESENTFLFVPIIHSEYKQAIINYTNILQFFYCSSSPLPPKYFMHRFLVSKEIVEVFLLSLTFPKCFLVLFQAPYTLLPNWKLQWLSTHHLLNSLNNLEKEQNWRTPVSWLHNLSQSYSNQNNVVLA